MTSPLNFIPAALSATVGGLWGAGGRSILVITNCEKFGKTTAMLVVRNEEEGLWE